MRLPKAAKSMNCFGLLFQIVFASREGWTFILGISCSHSLDKIHGPGILPRANHWSRTFNPVTSNSGSKVSLQAVLTPKGNAGL
jgi:hypothetical protein